MRCFWKTLLVCRYRRRIDGGHFNHSLHLLKLIVADLGLTDEYAAAQTLDQVTADGTEPPSGEWALGAMTHNYQVRTYFLGDLGNFGCRITGFYSRSS